MSTAKGRLPSAKMMERTIQGEDAACGKEEEKVCVLVEDVLS
ncbi:hypothetical protein HanXRQr2_Chr04g0155231 [Helianthus annuus]|uniref:Uncharacterized protein n=1 Tax=Helianthus annuus TaxID=4232 RepID=A0A9K3NQW3_HELAN|nr:hypothetical protein HanXRQr2_Chr04g0155231 [Helianthus annuus]KAJ0930429.1 hypothetical protein HanPSC8_Chr04g0149241 [Helianthus annuus]